VVIVIEICIKYPGGPTRIRGTEMGSKSLACDVQGYYTCINILQRTRVRSGAPVM
jgi:hypothetical protein